MADLPPLALWVNRPNAGRLALVGSGYYSIFEGGAKGPSGEARACGAPAGRDRGHMLDNANFT